MRFDKFSFGSIQIDGSTYEHDVIIDRGKVRKRKKKPSKQFREQFGHTPLSVEEKIPWKCKQLVIGTGAQGRLPVMEEVKEEAERRKTRVASHADHGGYQDATAGCQRSQRSPARDLLASQVDELACTKFGQLTGILRQAYTYSYPTRSNPAVCARGSSFTSSPKKET